MDEKDMVDFAKEVTKEIAKDVYSDAGKPVLKSTGELVGLVPRAIKAALCPLEKWIMQREYNIAETRKLLEEKLQNTPPEFIEPPEPHIAVPTMQYISYCMDNTELRDMYANLLANSMNKVVKNGVHPGFVEIIKQLSPDEAKILKYMKTHNAVPTITLQLIKNRIESIDIIVNFSIVGEQAKCENPYDVNKYFDNLVRLGLIEDMRHKASLSNKQLYEPLKAHNYIATYATDEYAKKHGFENIDFTESYVKLTSYGKSFCDICLSTQTGNVITISVE